MMNNLLFENSFTLYCNNYSITNNLKLITSECASGNTVIQHIFSRNGVMLSVPSQRPCLELMLSRMKRKQELCILKLRAHLISCEKECCLKMC